MTGWIWRLADAARQRVLARTAAAHLAAGRRGEDIAHRYLEREGYVVVARNWRAAGGEIDIIAWEGERLVFVEVKTRATAEHGAPDRNIDEAKRDALARAAREYARRAEADWQAVRFDTMSIVLSDPPHVEHVRDAFCLKRTL